jgi:AAA+ superfamily predicted ATPase
VQEAAFASNGEFLEAAMGFADKCLKIALSRRAENLTGPRGQAAAADLSAVALAEPRPPRDPALRQAFAALFSRGAQSEPAPPFCALCDLLDLTPFARFCALLALASACDRKYELLFGDLNDDRQQGEPNLGCALSLYRLLEVPDAGEAAALFSDERSGAFYAFAPPQEPGLRARLRLREKARLVALGSDTVSGAVAGFASYLEPDSSDLRYGLAENRLPELLLALLNGERNAVVQLLGQTGVGRAQVLRHFCAQTGLRALAVDCRRLFRLPGETRVRASDIAAEALLGGALVLLRGLDEAGDEAQRKETVDELSRRLKIVLLSAREPVPLPEGPLVLRVDFPAPTARLAREIWEDALAARPHEDFPVRALADKYILPAGQVREILDRAEMEATLHGETQLTQRRIVASVRGSAVRSMDGQARRINAFYTWDDLVVEEETARELRLFCDRVRYRAQVMEDWNFQSRLAYGRAVSALFYGVPGTGKTMAAQVVANDLDLDLYRVDLSQILNKYVGETEKNLGKIFDAAAGCGGILFFDEADALFAKRTEIADSKDKYANAETAFLLQKIEEFDGLVILATNLAYNFDDAFKRRINYMVHFSLPSAAQRRTMWEKVFPKETRAPERLDLDFLAESFELTGSTIKSIAVSAAYMAAAEGADIEMRHIIRALKHEYQKSGGILIKSKLREYDVD